MKKEIEITWNKFMLFLLGLFLVGFGSGMYVGAPL